MISKMCSQLVLQQSLSMGKTNIRDLNSLTTPYYIFDEAEFRRGVVGFGKALSEKFSHWLTGYSVKTNSLPFALRQAYDLGCFAEVVSHDEYHLAKFCGYQPRQIIYNGPMKSKETFLEAVIGGGIVNVETKRELDWLLDLPKVNTYKVGLRLNINISRISPEDAEGEDDNSRFGFSDQTDEFYEAVNRIQGMPNVDLAGIHIHRTAHSRSPRFYGRSVKYAAGIIKKYNLHLEYLDVGGGYFGIFPNKPTFTDYAEAIYTPLKEMGLEYLKVIIEPGNALIASCISLVTSVIDIKKVDDKVVFVTTDGSRNDVDPFFRKSDYIKEIVLNGNEDRAVIPLQVVTGCSCLEYDRLFSLSDHPELMPGDKIIYKNVGAYTMTLSPLFIRLFPSVYAMDEAGGLKLVRKRWDAENLIQQDFIE